MKVRFDYEIRCDPATGDKEQWLVEVEGERRKEYGPFKSFEGCRNVMNRIKRANQQTPGA